MSPQQLRSDMDAIRSVLVEGPAGKGPHRIILAGANIVCGLLPLVAVPFILLGTSVPMLTHPKPDGVLIAVLIGFGFSAFFVCLALPFFLAGWGLSKGRNWAPVAAIVAAVLNLMNVPFGTLISIYTFWALAKNKL
ncbi:hypothetical protein [Verrucomicrobium sp. BvORR106]|uniref:hypothetical protein n=1 Tax=Verrucomicrobium sp. BvORR106 TaxID=1403819 RepID=UPI002240EEFE|nr:hypothetical protein [Verrucomicrobium sp. BvORR106]